MGEWQLDNLHGLVVIYDLIQYFNHGSQGEPPADQKEDEADASISWVSHLLYTFYNIAGNVTKVIIGNP